ncbi:probable carboxylesterase 9 [Fagus crenata]
MSKLDAYAHTNLVLNPDGTVTRTIEFPTTDANPNATPGTPVVSKDVTLNVETKTWVRIYSPTKLPSTIARRLPIVLYFHLGGWVHFSVSDSATHQNCSQISSEILAIVVSVNYRLAPENKLPAQYHDAMDAIEWVKKQATNPEGEQWLRDYGEISRCYLYGIGCGGNIAFFSCLKYDELRLLPLKIAGIIMNQPMFGGIKRTESELRYAEEQPMPLPVNDLLWELALPKAANRDHRYCNPMVPGPHKAKLCSRLRRCLVIGFGGDPLVDRQQEFVKMLAACGVQVEARFDDVGFHYIDFIDPRWAKVVLNFVRDFII